MIDGPLVAPPIPPTWQSSMLDQHKAQSVPPSLYHFTSTPGLIGIATERGLFATHIAYMNDLGERRYGIEVFSSVLDKVIRQSQHNSHEQEFLDQIARHLNLLSVAGISTFVTSCISVESLAMYRMYCPPDGGYSIKIPGPRLSLTATRQDFELFACIYDAERQTKIAEELVNSFIFYYRTKHQERDILREQGNLKPSPGFWFAQDVINFGHQVASSYAPLFKHPSFEAEQEWRLIKTLLGDHTNKLKFRSGIRGITPYFNFDVIPSATLYPTDPDNHYNRLEFRLGPSGIEQEIRKAAVYMMFKSFEPHNIGVYDTSYRA